MATKRAQKKAPKPTPFSPTAVTQYPSEAAFNKGVDLRARGQLAPTLADIRARRQEEIGANTTRNRDIQGYYGYDLAARQAAQTRMQEALTGILNSVGAATPDAQAGLSAAMRPGQESNAAAAQQLGAMAPGTDPALASTLAAYGQGNKMSLGGDFGSYLARSAADIGLTGVEERQAGTNEMGVHRANLTGLNKERTAAMGQLPGLREQARSAMMQELLANSQNKLAWKQFGENRRSNKAGEGLAADQFGLAQDQFKESKRARRFDEKEARKQSQLNKDQLALARDELNAKVDQANTQADVDQATTDAKRFDSAAQYLQGYLAPGAQDNTPGGKSEGDPDYDAYAKDKFNPKVYKARVNEGKFHEVLVNLMTTYGLDRTTAYQVMRSAPIFRKKAEKFADAWQMQSYPH